MPHPYVGDDPIRAPEHRAEFLTTFSVFTLVPPQHQADDDAKRERGSERGNRTLRYQALDVIFLLIQGLAEFVQCCP